MFPAVLVVPPIVLLLRLSVPALAIPPPLAPKQTPQAAVLPLTVLELRSHDLNRLNRSVAQCQGS